MEWKEHIAIDPEVLAGKPVVRGTRLSVSLILGHLAQGWSIEDLLGSYPRLTEQGIRACLAYAQEILEQELVFPMVG
jgi:uncharacterized protein (DUF433 family)